MPPKQNVLARVESRFSSAVAYAIRATFKASAFLKEESHSYCSGYDDSDGRRRAHRSGSADLEVVAAYHQPCGLTGSGLRLHLERGTRPLQRQH